MILSIPAKKPAKRVYRSKEDIRKSKEDVRKSKEDLRKTRSKDDVRRTKSKDDVRKNKVEGTITKEEVAGGVEDNRCTCAEQEQLIMSSASISTKSVSSLKTLLAFITLITTNLSYSYNQID